MKGKKMMRAAPRAEARLNKENKGVVVRGSRFEVRRSKIMSCFAWDKKCEFTHPSIPVELEKHFLATFSRKKNDCYSSS